ncbi:MAG: hypothetical protein WC004_03855 [Candidatus Absconditabacterales bacterium]
MFFYYCFSDKFGYDQICRDEQEYGKSGDLLEANGSYFIALGQDISWKNMYTGSNARFQMHNVQVCATLFGKQTLQLIHWMVYQYYTSYRSVIHLFVGDIMQYLKSLQKAKTMKGKDRTAHAYYNTIIPQQGTSAIDAQSLLSLSHDPGIKQTLVVFPDLLSLRHRIQDIDYILNGQDSMSRVMKYYHDLQHSYKNILITTSANIFMDYKNLSQIICYFPETRYYKSQQNPRYYVPEILDKMKIIRKTNLILINI